MLEWLGITAAGEADRAVALAGLYQAAALVQSVARTGTAPADAVHTSLSSILRTDAQTPLAVFGDLDNLRLGFDTLGRQLGRTPGMRNLELTRYVSALVVLERTLAGQPLMLDAIAEGIEDVRRDAQHDDITSPHVVRGLARIYRTTLSTLTPRIMVSGEPELLKRDENAQLIRALLLAAVRSAVLWRQLGGSRRRILFTRGLLLELAAAAVNRTEAPPAP